MFKPASSKVSFPQMEEEVLRFWEEHQTFARSLENRKDAKEYIFYDGPPFATGLPHYGHLLAGIIKDIAPRYQTMRGHYVERRFGWDCHGLPIEALAQDKMGLAGTADIVAAGVDNFNETCRSMVLTYVEEWRRIVTRMGRWVDFDNDYKTMDLSFMETIWWVFKQLWEQDRVYKSHRIMPYSWKLTTPLSNFEAGSNYQDVQDPAITVRVKLSELPAGLEPGSSAAVYALIWTTTPWTLFGNLAICAGPEIDYVAVRDKADGNIYLLAEARLAAYYKAEDAFERLGTWKGADLKELTYEPIFPTFAGTPDCFRVLNDGFVSTADGTGIVHLAPAFGEDDFRICSAAGIPLLDYLDNAGAFTDLVPEYQGMFCKDADKLIIRRLKEAGQLVHQTTITHAYPFCPRTDTPLLYRAIEAWYVKVEDLHDRLVRNNATVHWMPAAVGEKRFGNWLKDAKDWNISRNRFWGSCIPIWINEADPADMICIGSVAELEELSGRKVTDLHKHHMDKILIQKDGKTYRRTPEVLDCWFESGSMPYAQQHYPFERADQLEKFFPADFIAEGLDQTRGWFYTLMLLSTALFDRSPYRNVIVNGLVLAEDGRKMSKRLQNYPDPSLILETHGADALRLYMINSPIVRAEDLNFSETGVIHSLRHLLLPWWNAYSFLVTYANIDGWQPAPSTQPLPPSANLLDRWILSTLDRLTGQVVAAMDAYDLQQAVRPLVQYIDELTNWYIRRSRRRFWKSDDDADKTSAYQTLHTVLLKLCQIAAPFTPFIAEEIYRNLRTPDLPESVHLTDYPLPGTLPRDTALEAQMQQVMTVVTLARQLRSDFNLKTRQPLAALHIICRDAPTLDLLRPLQDIIADELNVKTVIFGTDETALAHLTAKANFKTLGPKLGPLMRKAAAAIEQFTPEQLGQLLARQNVEVQIEDQPIPLTPEDILLQRTPKEGLAVASEGPLVVALETELTPDLLQEGLARELVNRIQNQRKTEGLDVADRITLTITADQPLLDAIQAHHDTIQNETLALTIRTICGPGTLDINTHPCTISLQKS